ncbi:MAG: formyltransferase family protein [Phascolarctobacterium faecium]
MESGKHEIAAVVTQPDRPKGRGQKMLMTPVKEYALSQGLPVYQPAKVKTPEVLPSCVSCGRDHRRCRFWAAAQSELLALPPLGCVMCHASLLPKYCGGTDPLCDFEVKKNPA